MLASSVVRHSCSCLCQENVPPLRGWSCNGVMVTTQHGCDVALEAAMDG